MSIEMIAVVSGILVVGLAIAAKLAIGRALAAKPVRVESNEDPIR